MNRGHRTKANHRALDLGQFAEWAAKLSRDFDAHRQSAVHQRLKAGVIVSDLPLPGGDEQVGHPVPAGYVLQATDFSSRLSVGGTCSRFGYAIRA